MQQRRSSSMLGNSSPGKSVAYLAIAMLFLLVLSLFSGCSGQQPTSFQKTIEVPQTSKPQASKPNPIPTAYDNSLTKLATDVQNCIDSANRTSAAVDKETSNPEIQNEQQQLATNSVVIQKYAPICQGNYNAMQSIKQQVEQLTPDPGKENRRTLFIQGVDLLINGLSNEIGGLEALRTDDLGRFYQLSGQTMQLYSQGVNLIKQATGSP
jgi:hypothetical protein